MIPHSLFVGLVAGIDLIFEAIQHLSPLELLILFIFMVIYWGCIAIFYGTLVLGAMIVPLGIYAWLEDELPRLMRPPKVVDPRRRMDELSDSYVRSVAQLLFRR